jgi:uncharacterized membrane protein (DUF485 family)
MERNKNRRVALLIIYFVFVLLIAFAAAAPFLLVFLCGMLAGGLISLLTFVYWLIKS